MKKLLLTALLVAVPMTAQRQYTLEKRLDAIAAEHTGVHARASCEGWKPGTAATLEVFMKYGGYWVSVAAVTTERTCSKPGFVALDFGWLAMKQHGMVRPRGRPESILMRLTTDKPIASVLSLWTAADFEKGETR